MSARAVTVVLLAVALAGSALAADRDTVVERWRTLTVADGLPSDKVYAVLVDGARVWVGTDEGLAVYEDGRFRVFGVGDGLPFPVVTTLALNPSSGDLWVGTMGGLARWSGGRFDIFTQLNSGLANNVIYGVAAEGTDVWVATASGLSRYDTSSGLWSIYDTTNTLMHEPWTYGLTLAEGLVHVAVWGGGVVTHDPRAGTFRAHRDPDGEMEIDLFRDDGLVHDVVSSIASDGGVLWVGTYFGLSRYDGRRWRSFSEQDSGLAGDFINYVYAANGAVWVATDQGLSRYDDSRWHTWRRGDDGGYELLLRGEGETAPTRRRIPAGPSSNMIFGIDVDTKGIWLATAAGLTRGWWTERTGATARKGDDSGSAVEDWNDRHDPRELTR